MNRINALRIGMITLFLCMASQSSFAQKIKKNEIIRYNWIINNSVVADSAEVFLSDTLELIKSYDLQRDEDMKNGNDEFINSIFLPCWELIFSNPLSDMKIDSDEFEIHYINLREASIRRRLWVDSLTFEILNKSPKEISQISSQFYSKLSQLETGEFIEIIDSIQKNNFHLQKVNDGFQVNKSESGRFVHAPKGVNKGFWTFSNQKLVFSNRFGDSRYEYRVERVDKLSIRLIRVL